MRNAIAVAAILAAAAPLAADGIKLPITADVGICAHADEVHRNTGGKSHVRIKGNEHYYLFRFDATAIRQWRITRATLHLKLARGRLRQVAICTVPARWAEGSGVDEPQRGAACFTHAAWPDRPWTPGGGTMMAATFNSPHMLWRSAKVGYNGKWMLIPIAPELVQAVAVGLSEGLVLADETGQTRENHDVYTRLQAGAKPYLMVEGTPVPPDGAPDVRRAPPRAEPWPAAASFTAGAIRIDVGDPFPKRVVAALGHRIRVAGVERNWVTFAETEIVVVGLPPGQEFAVTVETLVGPRAYAAEPVTVRASAAQVPPRPAPAAEAGAALTGFAPPTGRIAPILMAANFKTLVPVTPRNAWVGFQTFIPAPKGAGARLTAAAGVLRRVGPQGQEPPPLADVRVYRLWYVPGKDAYHPEALVPLGPQEAFDVPWQKNRVPGLNGQAIFVDVWVPKTAAPGTYEGSLVFRRDGEPVKTLALKLRVAGVTLPDTFALAGDMNAYASPARAMGVRVSDPKALAAMERKYYRLAHAHRMTLNVLPYTQAGQVRPFAAPETEGRGARRRISDWTQWDARYGPLLSGEAFSAKSGYVGPGAGVPVRHLYLPLHENWPTPLAESFRPWPPPADYRKFLLWSANLPPIDSSLARGFSASWRSAVRMFAGHLRRKKWTRTRAQVYLNNKYTFRRQGGRGVSLWLLDEPMHADDFLALAHFARLTRDALPKGSPIDFRIDISRPTHQRNWLDGLVDLNVCAGQLHSQRRLIAYRKRKFGEETWDYRMPPSFGEDNVGWAVWPVRSYCWGATGTLPWQTIASDGDLFAADATALMYPGRKFGLEGPIPSLRMKAWRQGLQIAELLRMLRVRRQWTDVQLRAFVGRAMGLTGWQDAADPKADSGVVTFAGVTAAKLEQLTRAALDLLERGETPQGPPR